MGKDEKKEMIAKVYREFSRQKYNKYKRQFPKMKESEIVSKIIKEWDALNGVAKDHLQKIYEKNKCLTLEDISSSEQLMKTELKKKEEQLKAKRDESTALKSASHPASATKMFPPQTTSKPDSESEYPRESKEKDDSRPVDSSSPKLIIGKSKKILKKSSQDYINFYRLRYNKLHSQHIRWTPKQISSIIKLEWKKEKSNSKGSRKTTRLGTRRPGKVLSGYRFYRKYRDFSSIESIKKWLRFPFETKVYWTRAASNKASESKKENLTLAPTQGNNFGFLVKKLATKWCTHSIIAILLKCMCWYYFLIN